MTGMLSKELLAVLSDCTGVPSWPLSSRMSRELLARGSQIHNAFTVLLFDVLVLGLGISGYKNISVIRAFF